MRCRRLNFSLFIVNKHSEKAKNELWMQVKSLKALPHIRTTKFFQCLAMKKGSKLPLFVTILATEIFWCVRVTSESSYQFDSWGQKIETCRKNPIMSLSSKRRVINYSIQKYNYFAIFAYIYWIYCTTRNHKDCSYIK